MTTKHNDIQSTIDSVKEYEAAKEELMNESK